MATCNQCLHRGLCNSHGYIDADECFYYRNKYDVVEVKHGEWLEYPSDAYMKCSVCGMEYIKLRMPHIVGYCPNCGAKMDGGKEE